MLTKYGEMLKQKYLEDFILRVHAIKISFNDDTDVLLPIEITNMNNVEAIFKTSYTSDKDLQGMSLSLVDTDGKELTKINRHLFFLYNRKVFIEYKFALC